MYQGMAIQADLIVQASLVKVKLLPALAWATTFTHICCFAELRRLQCAVEFTVETDNITLSCIWPETNMFGIAYVADLRLPNCWSE